MKLTLCGIVGFILLSLLSWPDLALPMAVPKPLLTELGIYHAFGELRVPELQMAMRVTNSYENVIQSGLY